MRATYQIQTLSATATKSTLATSVKAAPSSSTAAVSVATGREETKPLN